MSQKPLATISLDINKTLGRIKPMHAGFLTFKPQVPFPPNHEMLVTRLA